MDAVELKQIKVQEQEQQDEQQDDVDDDKEKEEEELGQAGLAAASGPPKNAHLPAIAHQKNQKIKKTTLSDPKETSKNKPIPSTFCTSDNHQHRSYRFIHFHVLINTMNPNEINQFLRLNSGKNEFQESFLAPSHPAIEQGDSCRLFFKPTAPPHPAHAATPAPQYSNAVTGVPHYANAVPGAHPTTTATMTAHPQPNLRIQPQVVSDIGNAHAGQLVSGFGNQYAGELVCLLPPGSAVHMVVNPGGAFPALQPAPQNATNTSTVAKRVGVPKQPEVPSPPRTELFFKYSVFVHSTTHEIEKFNSAKAPANDLNKSTLRIFSTGDIGWPASLDNYTWDSSLPAAFDMLGKTRQYLDKHLHHFFEEGELAFQFSLFRHTTHGGMSNFLIKSDKRFQEFAAAARADPSSRLTIAITMKNPRKIIKQNDVLESGNLELELMYAPEKQKVIKAKGQARLAVNPKADLDAVRENSRHPCVYTGGRSSPMRRSPRSEIPRPIRSLGQQDASGSGTEVWTCLHELDRTCHAGPSICPCENAARADTTPPTNGANRHSRTVSPPVDFCFSEELPETRPSLPEEERFEAVDELSTTAAGDSNIDDEDGQSAGDC
ncbi:hypothetical protein MJO28_004002 [Puccinia striiformis f. sp. tritici]|uniref:Uncharacterized protein n=1 Tax=Puccinia striiformis f. sp. tritici TaxID=168172 RepID=A0ACC0ER72_9BASI|nr:hypothetical protein MJO28_004002 [Puccinia striiformis f. sp. tritici]